MAKKKYKHKVVYAIIGFYMAALAKELVMAWQWDVQLDYLLLEKIELGYTFLPSLILIIFLDASAVWFMLRRRAAGLWFAISATIVKRIQEAYVLYVSSEHLDVMKEVMTWKRREQGRPVDEQLINQLINPTMLTVTFGFMMMFSVIIVLLLLWKRDYFYTSDIDDTTEFD